MTIRAACCVAVLALSLPAQALPPIPTDDPFMNALYARLPAIEACVPKSTTPSTVTVRLLPATTTTPAQARVLPGPSRSMDLSAIKIPGVTFEKPSFQPAATDPVVIACVLDAVRATPANVGPDSARDVVVQLAPAVIYRQVTAVPPLTQPTITAVLQPTYPGIARCVDRRVAAAGVGAVAASEVLLDFDIARDGTVMIKKLTPDVPDHLAICTREAIKGLVFPWPPSAPLNVKMPLKLSSTTPATTPAKP